MSNKRNITDASIYSKHSLTGTAHLAFKNAPKLISEHVKGVKTLDYGCGSGRSTRFLADLFLDVYGVDINQEMIIEAQRAADNGENYLLIEPAKTPYHDKTFDLVFSCLVLFEISSKKELLETFIEINRVLKDGGVFIAVTGSEEMYNHQWLSLDANYPENTCLSSGSLAKILLKEIGLVLYDYYWTDSDYKETFLGSDFSLVKMDYPLGDSSDGYDWASETTVSPYVTYVLKKK